MNALFHRLEFSPCSPHCTTPSFFFPGRILYAVNHSYPFSSNGYAVRTHEVAKAFVQTGLDLIAITRPGTPWDREGFTDAALELEHRIDRVRYIHLPLPCQKGKTLSVYTEQATQVLFELLQIFRPQAVMAASNWQNALPWALATRSSRVPFFYEVRGFWEISQTSRDPLWENTIGYREAVAGETAVAQAATRVFTINRQMREKLIRRGIAEKKIDLVPNGFPGWPEPMKNSGPTRALLGIHSSYVVGYIGSFNIYEGLEDLIKAVARLRARGVDVSLLLVGSSTKSAGLAIGPCPESEAYRSLATRLGISDYLLLPGRVAPEETAAYYKLMDVVVIPRRPFAVCELVSPMKPLEAAAHGKQVLLSDVAPLVDLAGLCPNFSYFSKGSIASLTDSLGRLLAAGDFTPPRCDTLAERNWANNILPMVRAVQSLPRKKGVAKPDQ